VRRHTVSVVLQDYSLVIPRYYKAEFCVIVYTDTPRKIILILRKVKYYNLTRYCVPLYMVILQNRIDVRVCMLAENRHMAFIQTTSIGESVYYVPEIDSIRVVLAVKEV